MSLAYWPLVVLGVIAAIILGVRWFRRADGSNDSPDGLAVANTATVRTTERYRVLARRHLRRALIGVISVIAMAAGSLLLMGRPSSATNSETTQHNRDIMICLDVSGSMLETDEKLLRGIAAIVGDMKGERVGLTVWNSSSVSVFPLTNDYAFIAEQLESAAQKASDVSSDLRDGTDSGPDSSAVPDGLMNCLDRFDRPDQTRARSVLLATDNDSGKTIFSPDEAFAEAKRRDVAVYGIAEYLSRDVAALKKRTQDTGGETYLIDEPGTETAVVRSITSKDAQRLEGSPSGRIADLPAPGLALVTAGLVGLALSSVELRRRPGSGRNRRGATR